MLSFVQEADIFLLPTQKKAGWTLKSRDKVITCYIVFLVSHFALCFVHIVYNCMPVETLHVNSCQWQHGTYEKSPAANLASANEIPASFRASPITCLVCLMMQSNINNKQSSYLYDFGQYLSESHCQSIRFLFQQAVSLFCTFQPNLHLS